MHLLLTVLVCLCLSGSTWGWRLPYILNGRDAEIGEFPWQASIQFSNTHSCGAALVTNRWLVSAAHCLQLPPMLYQVVLGAHDIVTREEGRPQTFTIEKFIAHPDFKYGLSDPDIGLIKLSTDATLDGTYVDKIPLAAADVGDLVGADCVITGWGKSKVGSNVSTNILQAASTRPLTYPICEAAVSDMPIAGPGIINDGHICVGGVGSEGSCHGDSGSPLVSKLEGGSKVLAGVTSWRIPDCDVNYPSIYSRISNFRKWLSDNSDGEV